jgi:ADP-ribosylglycohydrolase
MFGAIAGDIIGSPYEGLGSKRYDFPLFSNRSCFTDDTVLTIAIALAVLDGVDYAETLRDFGNRYPGRGYGEHFHKWLVDPTIGPYNSWGNGSAMRVSPIGYAFDSLDQVLVEAARTAEVTHNHEEGIRGAQAVALAVFLARNGTTKEDLRKEVSERFGYDMHRTVEEIRPGYAFDVSCQGSVPESIICFLESDDFESSVRSAVSLGGDTDTMACIAGAIAEAFYGDLPGTIMEKVKELLPAEFLQIVSRFNSTFMSHSEGIHQT